MGTIQFTADDATGTGYLATPKMSRGPGVVVLHAWWGLNDFFKGLCDRLAREGFVAFAPDLYHGQTASTIDVAKELIRNHDLNPPKKEVAGSVDLLTNHPAVKSDKVGVVGFSMGGAWALWLSTQKPESVAAVVVFCGTWDLDFVKSQAAFLGHYAETDEWEPIDGVNKVQSLLRSAGKQVEFHFYPGVKHWFFEENRPEYSPESAQLAWKRTVEFLHAKLD